MSEELGNKYLWSSLDFLEEVVLLFRRVLDRAFRGLRFIVDLSLFSWNLFASEVRRLLRNLGGLLLLWFSTGRRRKERLDVCFDAGETHKPQ